MDYTENTDNGHCKHVTLADIDDALQQSAHFSDVEEEFRQVQAMTQCSTGCGGCHDKIMGIISERLSGWFNIRRTAMEKYVCDICGYVYDPEAGDPDNGVAPGTPWEEVPEDWVCPLCGVGKDQFSPEE